MSPKARLRVWAVVVASCYLGMALIVVGVRADWSLLAAAGALAQGLGVAAIAWLLVTTPKDAIKLKPVMSWVLIGVGAILNVFASAWHIMLILTIVLIVVLPALPRRRELSPWWGVILLWSPAFAGVPIQAARDVSLVTSLAVANALLLGVVAMLVLGVSSSNLRPVGAAACVVSVLSGVLTAWYCLLS